MRADESRANQRLAVSVAFLLLAVAGMSKCIPALAAALLPSLQAQLGDHLGVGVAPLWVHEIVVLSMVLGAFFIWRHDTGLAALFSLVGALYANEPLLAIGIELPAVELLLVPLFVAIAAIEPEPVKTAWARNLLGALLVLSLSVTIAGLAGWFSLDGYWPWGESSFALSEVALTLIGLVAIVTIVVRCRAPLSLRSGFFWLAFGGPAVFLTLTLLPPFQWLAGEPEAVVPIVLLIPLAPLGAAATRSVHA